MTTPAIPDHRPGLEPSEDIPAARRRALLVLAILLGLVLALITGMCIFYGNGQRADADQLRGQLATVTHERDQALDRVEDMKNTLTDEEIKITAREDATAAKEKELATRETNVKGAEAAKAAATVREGTWVVGRDITPGTYVTDQAVGTRCYWAILKSGTNGRDIVNNDLPQGGRPTVTLTEGQDFKTSGCGTWTRQG